MAKAAPQSGFFRLYINPVQATTPGYFRYVFVRLGLTPDSWQIIF